LLKELSMKIEKGMNILVLGPNACGKSSLFRILSGIWPLSKGQINKPSASPLNGGIFFVP
jgi:ATP-binding cassette subfamily D (ALD) protein 3